MARTRTIPVEVISRQPLTLSLRSPTLSSDHTGLPYHVKTIEAAMIVTYEPSKLGPSATTTHTMKQIEDLARAAINQAVRNHCSLLSIKADLEVSMRACESEARRNVFELSFYDKALQITKGMMKH